MTASVEITRVIETIQHLKIDATYDNMNHLLGCLMQLGRIQNEVQHMEQKLAEVENQNGSNCEHECTVSKESDPK